MCESQSRYVIGPASSLDQEGRALVLQLSGGPDSEGWLLFPRFFFLVFLVFLVFFGPQSCSTASVGCGNGQRLFIHSVHVNGPEEGAGISFHFVKGCFL